LTSDPILVSANGRSARVYRNPSLAELLEIGFMVRFTAYNRTKTVYVWDFTSGHHADVSIGLKLDDKFDSIDFLKGHAVRNDEGIYRMVGSDFLQSFIGRMTGKDKLFLKNLLNQDWAWVDGYIQVKGWMDSFVERLDKPIFQLNLS
jgi:hypothetical protein